MTVTTTNASNTATGDGSNKTFPFTFRCVDADAAQVQVIVDGVVQVSGYTVTFNGSGYGGSVVFTAAPANAAAVEVLANPLFTQTTAFANGGAFLAEAHDAALDRSVMRDIRLKRDTAKVAADLVTETANRASADSTLQGNINTEASTRASADTALAGSLSSEATSRVNADAALTAALAVEAGSRASADTTEAATRLNAVNVLTANLASEIATRSSVAASLSTRIDTEATARGSADAGLLLALSGVSLTTATLNAANRTFLAALDHTLGLPAMLMEAGREGMFVWTSVNSAAAVTADPAQAIYVAPASDTSGASGAWVRRYSGPANAKWWGATGDGTTDDTTALTRAFAASSNVLVPAGTYIASALVPPANISIFTHGFATKFKQAPGTAAGVRLLTISASNITLGDCSVEGQLGQAGDTTGEQNHAIFINGSADLHSIVIGDVYGKNLRGDVVYAGMVAASGAKGRGIRVGNVYAENVWRNGVSVTDGIEGMVVASIVENTTLGCGNNVLDVEPDQTLGVRGLIVHYVRGRSIVISGLLAPVHMHIGACYLDPSFGADSSPVNTARGAVLTTPAFYYRGAVFSVGKLFVSGCQGPAIGLASGGYGGTMGSIGVIDYAEFTNNNQGVAGTVGAISVANPLYLRHFKFEARTAVQAGVLNSPYVHIGTFEYAGYNFSAALSGAEGTVVEKLLMTVSTVGGAGNGGIAVSGTSGLGCRIRSGTVVGERLSNFSTGCTYENLTGTFTSGYMNGGNTNNRLRNCIINTVRMDRIFWDASTVTQATSKTTAVPLDKMQGDITLNAENMASGAVKTFTLNNALIDAADTISVVHQSAGTLGGYAITARVTGAGVATITVTNVSGGALAEAIVLRYRVLSQ